MLFAASMLASKIKNGVVDNYHHAAFIEAKSRDEAIGLAYRLVLHLHKPSEGYQISVGVSDRQYDSEEIDKLTKRT